MSRFTVCARFRPLSSSEKQELGTDVCVQRIDEENFILKDEKDGDFTFSFDRVYYEGSNESDIFEFLAVPILHDASNGINGTIITYGQTGSRKTYSIPPKKRKTYSMEVEINMEKIRDVFDLSKDNLQIKDSKEQGILLDGVTEASDSQTCFHHSSADASAIKMQDGMAKREAEETRNLLVSLNIKHNIVELMNSVLMTNYHVNLASSRSHFVYIFRVQKEMLNKRIKTGKLVLVDLAGYVKEEKTGAEGRVLEEAKMIDKSLSTLGSVLNALTSGPKGKVNHVPYQDSKLTHLLQDALVLEFRHLFPSTKSGMETLGSNLDGLMDIRKLCEQRALEAFGINETNWTALPSSKKLIQTIEEVCFRIIVYSPALGKKKIKTHPRRNFKILLLHAFPEDWFEGYILKKNFYIINESGKPDYESFKAELDDFNPSIVVCCSANIPLFLNYIRIEEICIERCCRLVLDISHISSLILAGLWTGPSPFDHSQAVISRFSADDDSLLIFVNNLRLHANVRDQIEAYSIDSYQRSYVYMAALLENATSALFRSFQENVVQNAMVFSQAIESKGYRVVVRSSQNTTPFVFVYLKNKDCTASQVCKILEMIGTSILTSRRFTRSDIEVAANIVDSVVQLVVRIVTTTSEKAAAISTERFESLLEAYQEDLNAHRLRGERLLETCPQDINILCSKLLTVANFYKLGSHFQTNCIN
ncbi:hypothetical protein V2J09_007831 [Rumex salicifolius]